MIIRLRGIKTYRSKGKVYHYHRATGKRMTSQPRTAAFVEEAARLDALAAGKAEKPGTLGGLICAYRASPEWERKSALTRRDYQRIFDYLKPLCDDPISSFTPAFVIKLRDKTFKLRKQRFANYTIQVLSMLFNWGRPREITDTNPCDEVPKLSRSRAAPTANRAWTAEELDVVLASAPAALRTPVALGAYAGLRMGDVVALTWTGVKDGVIDWTQRKTGDPVWIPIHSALKAIINVTPRAAVTVVTGARGAPLSEEGLKTNFGKLIRRLEVEGKVGKGLTFHGLRHTAAKMLAEAGGDVSEIMAFLGHKTASVSQHYAKEAHRRNQAKSAVRKLEDAEGARGKKGTP
jgi:integrase